MLIHGNDDTVLLESCTRTIYGIASDPKEKILLNGNGHVLNKSADEVKEIVYKCLSKELKP